MYICLLYFGYIMFKKKTKKNFFEIRRIYIKNAFFEASNTPNIFCFNWKPDIKLNLNTFHKEIEENVFEIILKVKVIVNIEENLVFLCDVKQAGIFFIPNLKGKELKHCLYSYCPNILFPYARECISNLISHASFPQMNLAPINFDSIYQNYIKDT